MLQLLARRIREASREAAAAEGWDFPEHPSYPVIDAMVVDFERGGRAAGAGFYDYADGKRAGLWSGLKQWESVDLAGMVMGAIFIFFYFKKISCH